MGARSLRNYARDTQCASLRERNERKVITEALWKIKCGIPAANVTRQVPPMEPRFFLGMMGLDNNGVTGRDRGALRNFWSREAIPFRLQGCAIEHSKDDPDPSNYCGLTQTRTKKNNNDMRNVCPYCNIR